MLEVNLILIILIAISGISAVGILIGILLFFSPQSGRPEVQVGAIIFIVSAFFLISSMIPLTSLDRATLSKIKVIVDNPEVELVYPEQTTTNKE